MLNGSPDLTTNLNPRHLIVSFSQSMSYVKLDLKITIIVLDSEVRVTAGVPSQQNLKVTNIVSYLC